MNHLISWRNLLLTAPVLAVEGATGVNLITYYAFHELLVAAVMIAVSFSALLIASAILISQDVGWLLRGLLVLGGICLFGIQAASNVSIGFLTAGDSLPSEELSTLWGASPERWRVLSSWVWGTGLNIVGATYWLATGLYLRRERQREAEALAEVNKVLTERR